MCVLAPSQKVLCPQTRNPWVLSSHHSGCTVSGDVLHRCCSAAWHGASQVQPGKVKKNPKPKQTKHPPKTQQKIFGQRWVKRNPRASAVWCLWTCGVFLFVCWDFLFFFFSAVTWVKRGTRVHKCDPLAQR